MKMNFDQALSNLQVREEWDFILDYLSKERESAIADFQNPDYIDNACKLARLAGEIAAFDRVIQNFQNGSSTSQAVSG
jgi:hypothetical protein